MLIEEIERALNAELNAANVEAIENGSSITTVLTPDVMNKYIGDDIMTKCEEIVTTLGEVGKKWGYKLELHFYFLPYKYIYVMIISKGPTDDDGDFLSFTDPVAVPIPASPPPTPTERPMAMAAGAGKRF